MNTDLDGNVVIYPNEYNRLKDAYSIEQILCLATLVASGILFDTNTIEDASNYYQKFQFGCDECPFQSKCLACIINQ